MRTRPTRRAFSRRHVIDTALRLVDEGGLRRLTMRALADEIGTAPMNLYAHFAGKEQLLDQLFEGVLERLLETERRPTWQEDVAAACHHGRGVLLAHRNWHTLLARPTVPPKCLHFYDRLVERMCADGFTPEHAMQAFFTLLNFTLGTVLVERMMSDHHQPSVPVQQLALVREMMGRVPAGAFPGIVATAPTFGAFSFEAQFEMGIRLLIDGLEASRARRSSS